MKTKKDKANIIKKREKRAEKRCQRLILEEKKREFDRRIRERDNDTCQITGKCFKGCKPQSLQIAHVLSKENYPELMWDDNNVLCLSYYSHKNSPLSPHLDGFAFVHWFKEKFPDRFEYLVKKLNEHKLNHLPINKVSNLKL